VSRTSIFSRLRKELEVKCPAVKDDFVGCVTSGEFPLTLLHNEKKRSRRSERVSESNAKIEISFSIKSSGRNFDYG
jgi:hypothetical protein